MIFYFWSISSKYFSLSSLLPSCPSFLTYSSSEKFWNCLQDVWLEWRWRSRHGRVWTGKFSWKFPLITLTFNTFSCTLEFGLDSIFWCYPIFGVPKVSFFRIISTYNRWGLVVCFYSKCKELFQHMIQVKVALIPQHELDSNVERLLWLFNHIFSQYLLNSFFVPVNSRI